jgi:FADH2 O2-dependent halogenase
MNNTIECDALIIGASLAGGCLARQLKLKHPDMNIVILDKKKEFGAWVGESTLEIFWDYAVRHLDLGHYLDTNHLYKHGLRWWFDSKDKNLPISKMSEIGRTWYHSTPAYQLDREKFDKDLYDMNLSAGIDIRLGHKVTDIQIDKDSGHTITTKENIYKCRWLIDAAGLSAPLGRKLDLIKSVHDKHPIKSYWGRIKNMENMDLMGDINWREKVNHTSRYLSTNHFMYKGYWMWIIPLDATTTSIGLTVHEGMADIKIKNKDAFMTFFKEHKVFDELFSDNTIIEDFHGLTALPRHTEQAYSEDRWFMTGMSAGFIDPLFSTSCALISDTNRMIGDLIDTDIKGDEEALSVKTKTYNVYTRSWWELVLQQVRGQYSGSYDVHRMHYQPLAMGYFGIMLPRSMSEQWSLEEPSMLKNTEQSELLQRCLSMVNDESTIQNLHNRREEFEKFLDDNDATFLNNSGEFFDSLVPEPVIMHMETFGRHFDLNAAMNTEKLMYEECIDYSLRKMTEISGYHCNEPSMLIAIEETIFNNLTLFEGIDLYCKYENLKNRSTENSAVAI